MSSLNSQWSVANPVFLMFRVSVVYSFPKSSVCWLTSSLGCEERNAKSVKSCVFLNKPARRKVSYSPDYIGYDIPDAFVVGYGLDYDEHYRNLPYIGILKPEVSSK